MFDETKEYEGERIVRRDFEMHITKGDLFKALSDFQGKCQHPKKTATNPFYKSKYAPLDSCITANQELLAKCGLSIMQFPIVEEGNKIGLVTILTHSGGDYIQGRYLVKAEKETAQSLGSAITYLRRYSYCAVLGLAAEDDDDANSASGVVKKQGSIRGGEIKVTKPVEKVAEKQIHTQKVIEDKLKEITTVAGLKELWIECTSKQQETEKILNMFGAKKDQLNDEAKAQTEYETGLFPDLIKVIKHINQIDNEVHLQNWYKKHLPEIQKLEARDYKLVSDTLENRTTKLKEPATAK